MPYFHVVFTLPAQLRRLCRRNDRELYNLLFEAGAKTLLRLGEDAKWLGARVALTAVLHTWTRELDYHPHLHCIVTAGGLAEDGLRFVHGSPKYLFPIPVMAALYRGLFLDGLAKMAQKGEIRCDGQPITPLLDLLYQTERLISMDDEGVCFATKGGRRITLEPQKLLEEAATPEPRPEPVPTEPEGPQEEAESPAEGPEGVEDFAQKLLRLCGVDVTLCPKCQQGRLVRKPLPEGPPAAVPLGADTS